MPAFNAGLRDPTSASALFVGYHFLNANRQRLRLHPDRVQSGHLRAAPIPNQVQGDHPGQQLALAARRRRRRVRIRPLRSSASTPPICRMPGSTARTPTGCASAARSRRLHRTAPGGRQGLGLPARGIPVLSGRRRRSTSASAAATGTCRLAASPTSRDHVVGFTALPQVVDWKVENFGVFLQASVKLGPYPVIEVH